MLHNQYVSINAVVFEKDNDDIFIANDNELMER